MNVSETRGLILDIDKFATHDGPGIRTAVYLKGCPMRCAWCHSPESQEPQPQLLFHERKCNGCGSCVSGCPETALSLAFTPGGESDSEGERVRVDWLKCTNCGRCASYCFSGALRIAGEWMSVDQVVTEVEKDAVFFHVSGGGVTVTGGEVSAQARFTFDLLKACRDRGIHTAVETSGYGRWEPFRDLAEVTSLFLYDLKLIDDEHHRVLTGVSNRLIHDNLRRLVSLGADVVVRVPCIPGLTDSDVNVEATASFTRELGIKVIHLLPYNPAAGAKYGWTGRAYGLAALSMQSNERMQRLAAICQSLGLKVQIIR